MENKDKTNTHGQFRLQTYDTVAKKFLQDTGWIDNLGMNGRLAVISGLYGNVGSETAFSYLALGTSATAVSATQTALVAELTTLGLARASATVTQATTTATNDTTVFAYTWTASGSTTVNEIGYFNAASSGVMGGRALTGALVMNVSIQLIATYKVIHT